MKVIEIPKPLTLKLKTQTGEITQESKFPEWASNMVDFYGEGVKTIKQVRQVQKIVDALDASNGTVSLEDADYDLLKAALEAYPGKISPHVLRQHLPFIDAIEAAQDVKKG